jgi:hypothetical protein
VQWKNCAISAGATLEAARDERLRWSDAREAHAKALGFVFALAMSLGALFIPATLSGCSNACDAAADKVASCSVASADGGSNASPATCDSWQLCQANCINNATCAEILYPGSNTALTECETVCLGK